MTPNAIEILIHCHVSPTVHPRSDAPAVKQELQSLEQYGLIRSIAPPGAYTTTERGAAHVAQLCATPWPKQTWVDAQGKPIDV